MAIALRGHSQAQGPFDRTRSSFDASRALCHPACVMAKTGNLSSWSMTTCHVVSQPITRDVVRAVEVS
ncbi:MAG TPA: hypothetical protein VM580_09830 [Labilithrix sp.]|nr:hypothetical protein [Labilithrix sp.]